MTDPPKNAMQQRQEMLRWRTHDEQAATADSLRCRHHAGGSAFASDISLSLWCGAFLVGLPTQGGQGR